MLRSFLGDIGPRSGPPKSIEPSLRNPRKCDDKCSRTFAHSIMMARLVSVFAIHHAKRVAALLIQMCCQSHVRYWHSQQTFQSRRGGSANLIHDCRFGIGAFVAIENSFLLVEVIGWLDVRQKHWQPAHWTRSPANWRNIRSLHGASLLHTGGSANGLSVTDA